MRTSEPAVQKATGTTNAIKAMGILREMKVRSDCPSPFRPSLTASFDSTCAEQGLKRYSEDWADVHSEVKTKSNLLSFFSGSSPSRSRSAPVDLPESFARGCCRRSREKTRSWHRRRRGLLRQFASRCPLDSFLPSLHHSHFYRSHTGSDRLYPLSPRSDAASFVLVPSPSRSEHAEVALSATTLWMKLQRVSCVQRGRRK